MVGKSLSGPVGKRWNTQNVANRIADQKTVIGLLASITVANGGKKERWPAPPLSGAAGSCPPLLLDAIWDFQRVWKSRGVFHNIDGVVDPGGRTLQQLNKVAGNAAPIPSPVPAPTQARKLIKSEARVPGTWQITNVWSLALGEVGMVGAIEMEITDVAGKKFVIRGAGTGAGVGIDPIAYAKALKAGLGALSPFAAPAAASLAAFLEMIGKGVGFSLGDYLQKLGVSLSSVTAGRLIPNPINQYLGRPTVLSRSLITGAGIAPFAVNSAGGGVLAGGEAGVVFMGGVLAPVIGCYGSIGVTMKLGIGAQAMLYSPVKIYDVP